MNASIKESLKQQMLIVVQRRGFCLTISNNMAIQYPLLEVHYITIKRIYELPHIYLKDK